MFLCCQQKDKAIPNLFRRIGMYNIDDQKKLTITNDHGIVNYKIESEKKILLSSNRGMSVYENWYLYWDAKTSSLWVSSSDIGLSVWEKERLEYREIIIRKDDRQILDSMPEIFKNELPSSLKAYLGL